MLLIPVGDAYPPPNTALVGAEKHAFNSLRKTSTSPKSCALPNVAIVIKSITFVSLGVSPPIITPRMINYQNQLNFLLTL
jgi:hypothetical protein